MTLTFRQRMCQRYLLHFSKTKITSTHRQFIKPCYNSHFLKPNNSHPQATPWSALVVLTTRSFGCDRTGAGWTQPKRPPRWELKSQLKKTLQGNDIIETVLLSGGTPMCSARVFGAPIPADNEGRGTLSTSLCLHL